MSILRTALVALFAIAVASAVRADFTFDVAVSVAELAPEVSNVRVQCQACVGDCQYAKPPRPVADGVATHNFPASGPRTFNGKINVVAKSKSPPADQTATDYICVLFIGNSKGQSMSPGQPNESWTQPRPGAPYTPTIRGKLK